MDPENVEIDVEKLLTKHMICYNGDEWFFVIPVRSEKPMEEREWILSDGAGKLGRMEDYETVSNLIYGSQIIFERVY